MKVRRRHVMTMLLLSLLLVVAETCCSEPTDFRNAIFNGNFEDGVSGWMKLGPGYQDAELGSIRHTIAHRVESELLVTCKDLKKSFTVYSAYGIKVAPGKTYPITLTAKGEGDFAFGAFEYSQTKDHLGNNYSQRFSLTQEVKTFTFDYQPSAKTVDIRAAIIFFDNPPGGAVKASIINFDFPLASEGFRNSVTWPQWKYDKAFINYQGFSQDQLKKIRDSVKVEEVLAPYHPIRRIDKKTFNLTTSEYRFGKTAFPESIHVLGKSLLSAPINLRIDTEGLTGPTKSFLPSFSLNNQEMSVRHTTDYGPWALEVVGNLAYDALMQYTVSIVTKEEIQINRVELVIPFSKQIGKYIRYQKDWAGKGSYFFGYGPIPQPGEKVEVKHAIGITKQKNNWTPLVSSDQQTILWEWKHGFIPFVWIGDEERGLGWISESDEGWNYDPNESTLAIERRDNSIIVHLIFINHSIRFKGKRTIQFALQATPPKPIREDWFKLHFNRFWVGEAKDNQEVIDKVNLLIKEHRTTSKDPSPPVVRYADVYDYTFNKILRPAWDGSTTKGFRDIGFLWWNAWSLGCGSPQVANPEKMKAYLQATCYLGHLILPYLAPTHLSNADPNGYFYGIKTQEWATLPPTASSYYVKVCPKGFASEYQAYEVGKLIDTYKIDGIYFDNCAPELCRNIEHGCGYRDEKGEIQPIIPFLGLRKLFMMVRHEFLKRGKTPLIMCHSGYYPAAISFADLQLDGEGTYGTDHTEMITPGEWRARYLGPNQFGTILTYLPQFGYGVDTTTKSMEEHEREGTRPLMAPALLHGTPIFCQYIHKTPMFKAWDVFDQLDENNVKFIPYWQWDVNKKLNPNSVYATLYRQSRKAALVVSNLSSKEALVEIPVADLRKVFPTLSKVEDRMDSLPLELSSSHLTLTVGQKNFRLILLK